jgi:hypothetical protein
MAEEVLRAGPAARLLATSREPLRAEGEWLYPVLPLAVPAEDARDEDLQQYGAVRLFVERARAVDTAPARHVGTATAKGESDYPHDRSQRARWKGLHS